MGVFSGSHCCVSVFLAVCWCSGGGGAVWAEQVALVEVFVQQDSSSRILQGQLLQDLQDSLHTDPEQAHQKKDHQQPELQGDLRLVRDEDEGNPVLSGGDDDEDDEGDGDDGAEEQKESPWIGVVPVEMEEGSAVSNGNQESFAAAVVSKVSEAERRESDVLGPCWVRVGSDRLLCFTSPQMKRALVLGASALIILVLNQNSVREMDLSQVLSKPVIIIQTSENVTRLIGALLRGLHTTAKITYKTFLQDNLGATLTLWSSCGRSRGGLYGEWQGVICTGETNSPVQKYLQQLWNTVVLVALILSTGVIVHARWQYHDNQFNDELQLRPKQDLLKSLSTLKTRTYRQPKARSDPTHGQPETDSCAVCLEQYNNNQCLRVLPCLHEFHRDCVDPWLLLQQTCPLCKRSALGTYDTHGLHPYLHPLSTVSSTDHIAHSVVVHFLWVYCGWRIVLSTAVTLTWWWCVSVGGAGVSGSDTAVLLDTSVSLLD
ncbi:hypothetical protein NFI96_024114 [Prochilodus magdalenae]|nr:hypothetical protein NFI96_024114 [Prochilodus magdalenae]